MQKVDLRQQLVENLRHGVSSNRAWWIIDQWRTRLETCLLAEGGHFEQQM